MKCKLKAEYFDVIQVRRANFEEVLSFIDLTRIGSWKNSDNDVCLKGDNLTKLKNISAPCRCSSCFNLTEEEEIYILYFSNYGKIREMDKAIEFDYILKDHAGHIFSLSADKFEQLYEFQE